MRSYQSIIQKLFYLLAFITLIYPAGVALINLLKEGYNPYWLPYLSPPVVFLLIGISLSYRKKNERHK